MTWYSVIISFKMKALFFSSVLNYWVQKNKEFSKIRSQIVSIYKHNN